jgi:hypothetical protein
MVKTVWKQIDDYLKDRNKLYMFGIGVQEIIVMFIALLIPVLAIVLLIWALVDILKNEFTGSNKLIWVILVLFLPLLGSILYFTIGTKQKILKQESKQGSVIEDKGGK